jgi:hypothetical protein
MGTSASWLPSRLFISRRNRRITRSCEKSCKRAGSHESCKRSCKRTRERASSQLCSQQQQQLLQWQRNRSSDVVGQWFSSSPLKVTGQQLPPPTSPTTPPLPPSQQLQSSPPLAALPLPNKQRCVSLTAELGRFCSWRTTALRRSSAVRRSRMSRECASRIL